MPRRDELARWLAALALLALPACSPSITQAPACVAEQRPAVALVVAGTGAALPIAERAAAVLHTERAFDVWVPESIGSRGAVAALLADAIDVGLIARPLRPDEEQRGLEARLIARSPLVFAAHVPRHELLDRVDEHAIVAMIDGSRMTWPDGTPLVFVLREAGDAGTALMGAQWPAFDRAVTEARLGGTWPVRHTDQQMLTTLIETPGAIGLIDLALLRHAPPSVVALPVAEWGDPRDPSVAARWPVQKPLALVLPANPDPAALEFARVATDPSRGLAAELGYNAP